MDESMMRDQWHDNFNHFKRPFSREEHVGQRVLF